MIHHYLRLLFLELFRNQYSRRLQEFIGRHSRQPRQRFGDGYTEFLHFLCKIRVAEHLD